MPQDNETSTADRQKGSVKFAKVHVYSAQRSLNRQETIVDLTSILIAAGGLLIGFVAGSLAARTLAPQAKKQRELEDKLRKAEDELKDYQQTVSDHFVQSAELLRNLTESYRSVGEHLTNGALTLASPEASRDILDALGPRLPDRKGVRTLSAIPPEPPKDYAPSVPGGVLSEHYGLADGGDREEPRFLYNRNNKDDDAAATDADNDDPTYKVG